MAMRDTTDSMMGLTASLKQLSENWWLLLLQGILSIILGILALVWPGLAPPLPSW